MRNQSEGRIEKLHYQFGPKLEWPCTVLFYFLSKLFLYQEKCVLVLCRWQSWFVFVVSGNIVQNCDCGWQSWFVSAVRGKDCSSHSCITNCHPLWLLIRKWTAPSVLMAMAPTNVASAPATLVAMVTTASATPQKLAVSNLTKNACEYLFCVFLQAQPFFPHPDWFLWCMHTAEPSDDAMPHVPSESVLPKTSVTEENHRYTVCNRDIKTALF